MSRKLFFLWLAVVVFFGIHLDSLNQRIVRIEEESKAMRDISSDLFAVRSKTVALQNILSDEDFAKGRRIYVFKSTQNGKEVEDTIISSAPGQANRNWGKDPRVGAGYDNVGNVYRTLIRFNGLKKAIPKKAKIIAATVYLKQADNDGKDNQALRESFDLWGVEKKWGEGNKSGSRASQGEATWNAAAEGLLKWDIPGCSAARSDVNDTLVGGSGPNVNGGGNDWVAFSFIPPGITRLNTMIRNEDEPDYGFLIQLAGEQFKKKKTFVTFYSSDDPTVSDRPYIEVIYIDQDSDIPNHAVVSTSRKSLTKSIH